MDEKDTKLRRIEELMKTWEYAFERIVAETATQDKVSDWERGYSHGLKFAVEHIVKDVREILADE